MNNSIHHSSQHPIVALCTPQGSGAIALIRISGYGAIDLCASFATLPSKKSLSDIPSHTVCYGNVVDQDGNLIDSVMFTVMRAPKSFTGDDTVEITSHNNPFIIQKIIYRALSLGALHAKAGEFCQRAFLNGKIDILQAEAITDLITANNDITLKQSLAQIKGSLSSQIIYIEENLLKALSLCRASFEFIEEENIEFAQTIIELINNVTKIVKNLKNHSMTQKQIRSGFRIAFLGTVNAGKSSLFNALIGHKRAIVTNIPGTTRDCIQEGLYIDGLYWTLIDTAGLRVTNDIIEQEGIIRSQEEAHNADIILLIYDKSQPLTEATAAFYKKITESYFEKIIFINNKCDLLADTKDDTFLYCSAKTGFGIDIIKESIRKKVQTLCAHKATPFLLNTRQNELIHSIDNLLINLEKILAKKSIAYEIAAYHLEEIISLLSQLTGKSISEASMDKIFRDFCVGK